MFFEALALVALIGSIAQILKSEIQEKAGKEYQKFLIKSKEYEEKLKIANKELDAELSKYQNSIDFHRLCDLHFRSTQIANEAYEALNHGRETQKVFFDTINSTKQEISNFKIKKENYKRNSNVPMIRETNDELKSLFELKKILYEELDLVKQETRKFNVKVEELNKKTTSLKYQIKDSSERGAEWFNKLESRIRNKRGIIGYHQFKFMKVIVICATFLAI